MKRLLIVLCGVLVFQGSVWAQFDGMSSSCRKAYPIGSNTGAKILHPVSAGVVLKKKAPFLLQWKDVEVSETVNIRLYKKGAKDKDLFGKRLNNRPNTGTALITKQDFKRAKVKAGEQYFFQVEWKAHKNALWQVISSECFTFNVKQKEDLQCYNATTVKDCLQALIDQNKQILALVEENSNRLDALEAGGGTVGGGDGKPTDDSKEKRADVSDRPMPQPGDPWVRGYIGIATACWDAGQIDGARWEVGTNRCETWHERMGVTLDACNALMVGAYENGWGATRLDVDVAFFYLDGTKGYIGLAYCQ